MTERTLLDKVWAAHLVAADRHGADLRCVDRHPLHEVLSPRAFSALAGKRRPVRRPGLALGGSDDIASTKVDRTGADEDAGNAMLARFRANTAARGIAHLDILAAGFEWREPGWSFCLTIDGDRVGRGEPAVSTSNRTFEGGQEPGSRTHLASPVVAAAGAVAGLIAGPEDR